MQRRCREDFEQIAQIAAFFANWTVESFACCAEKPAGEGGVGSSSHGSTAKAPDSHSS